MADKVNKSCHTPEQRLILKIEPVKAIVVVLSCTCILNFTAYFVAIITHKCTHKTTAYCMPLGLHTPRHNKFKSS